MSKYNTGKYVCTLSPELLEKAKKELNEDPDRREEAIDILRQWIIKQPHINGRTDDAFLLKFLRHAKWSVERAKQRIDNYYTMRTALPEWFKGWDINDPKLLSLLKTGLFLPLGYDKEGRRVTLGRFGQYDPSTVKSDELLRLNQMLAEYLMWDEQTQICGSIFVQDMTGMTGAHMAQFPPTVAKKSMMFWQECFPVRMKGMHYWKPPSFFEAAFNLVKVFMKEKMLKRVVVHGSNLESLHKAFPVEILPKEYGGTRDINEIIDQLVKDMQAERAWFLEEEKYNVDESKRPGKPKTMDDIFGIDGTFRKLNID